MYVRIYSEEGQYPGACADGSTAREIDPCVHVLRGIFPSLDISLARVLGPRFGAFAGTTKKKEDAPRAITMLFVIGFPGMQAY